METAREFLDRRARHASRKGPCSMTCAMLPRAAGGIGPSVVVGTAKELLPRCYPGA